MIQINCNAQDATTDVECFVRDDQTQAKLPATVENPSRVVFKTDTNLTGGASIWVGKKEFCRFVWPFLRPGENWVDEGSKLGIPTLTFGAVGGAVPMLGVDHGARRIINATTGEKVTLAFHSDFRVFPIFRAGGDLEGLLNERREKIGTNGLRWFTTCENLFHLAASDYSDDQLRECMQWLADHGWMQAVVANTDVQKLGHDPQRQLDRVANVANGIPGVIVQAGNEWQNNGYDPNRLHKPATSALVTHGSSTGDTIGPLPGWDLADFHHRRDWKWPVTVPQTAAENAQPLGQCPEWGDEPIGIGNDGRGDRTTDSVRLHKMGIDMGMWMAGGLAHILAGLQSTPMPDEQVDPGKSFIDGVKTGGAK